VVASRLSGALRVDNMTSAEALLEEYRLLITEPSDGAGGSGDATPAP